jgi:hypothetical protein
VTSLLSLLCAVLSTRAATLKPTGLVCIDPIPKSSVWKANDTGATERSVFSVQIDSQSPVTISTNLAGAFTNLASASKHVVKIRLAGKPLTSFRFMFQDYESDHLRLWYNTVYGTWSLTPADARHTCVYQKR